MPPWDKKVAGYSYLVNETLQPVFEDKNNNKQRQATTKNSVEKCQKKLKFFSENLIYDPVNVFPKTMGTISVRIVW